MILYTIRNWNDLFENNRTRALKKMDWIPLRNKHDGDGYTELVSEKDGPALFGTWVILLQIASKCDPRGHLIRETGVPHTPESLSRMSRFPIALIARALSILVGIKWMESTPYEATSQSGTTMPESDVHPALGCGAMTMERKGTERKGTEVPPNPLGGEFVQVDSPVKDLPEHLNTGRMQAKWKVWMTVRMGKNKVKSWPTLFNEQIDWLTGFDEATAFESLSQSIRNGWQGLFEPKEHAQQRERSREKGYDTGKTLAQNLTSKTLRDTDATIRRLERMDREPHD